jgi:hypothetical protein
MEDKVTYFDSIKRTGTDAQVQNTITLGVLRQTYVDQAAQLTASRVDQGSKFEWVSAGLALIVLPFVKFNTSTVTVGREAVSTATNDVARTSARLAQGKEAQTLESLGFTYKKDWENHIYTLKEWNTLDLSKVTLPPSVTLGLDGKSLVSQKQLSLHTVRSQEIDVRKGTSTSLVVEIAKEAKTTTELTDMYRISGDGRTYTFNEKFESATLDTSAIIARWAVYDANTKIVTLPEGMKIVMKPEKWADGILTKLTLLPESLTTKDTAQDAEVLRNLEKALAGSIYVMSREAKRYPDFTEFLTLISDQKYSDAATALEGMKKYQVTQNIMKALQGIEEIKKNPDKLAVILTYTYGAINRLLW